MKTAKRVIVDQKAIEVLNGAKFAYFTGAEIARILGTDYVNVWRARGREGYVSPALLRAMAAGGYLDPHEVAAVLTVEVPPCSECGGVHTTKTCTNRKSPDRGRTFAARVPDDLFDEITAEARRAGLTNGQMLLIMWDYFIVAKYGSEELARRLAEAAKEE